MPPQDSPAGRTSSSDETRVLEGGILRYLGMGRWEKTPAEAYKKTSATWRGITRFELAGKRGEKTAFHLRYFEIEAGGYSTLERHRHEHVVFVLRGEGEVQLGCEVRRVRFGDLIRVAPEMPHQFRNPDGASEPFGFLCIVDAERDRPVPLAGSDACGICE